MLKEPEPPGGDAVDFGRRIRQWRERQGLTLSQLAARSELSAGYLSLLERGQKTPSPEAAASLARALGDDESLYRSWAAALRAGVTTSDVMFMRADTSRLDRLMDRVSASTDPYGASFEMSAARGPLEETPPEPDIVAVRVLPTHADPVDPSLYGVAPLYLDRRFIGAEPGDRLFAYEMTPEAADLLDDVAKPGDHIVFSSRVTRITPSRVYAVRTDDRVVAARLGLIGEGVVIVPSGGERDVQMVKGDWRDVVRGVAVVVIRRLLPSRPSSDRRPRFATPEVSDRDLIARLVHGGSDAVMELRRRYEELIERAIRRSAMPENEHRALVDEVWGRLTDEGSPFVRRWKSDGSFTPYLARIVRWAFNDHARRARGMVGGQRDFAGEDILDTLPPGALGALDILRDRERMKAIERVVGPLNARDQDLIYRRYVFDEPNAAIAEALRMSVSGVHVALHRARFRFERLAQGADVALLRPFLDRMSRTV